MSEQPNTFTGAGGLRLHYNFWCPESQPKAAVVISHGVGEHIYRYANLVDRLVPAGYAVCAFDQRGHGKSQGQRAHINSWSEYREDLGAFTQLVKKSFPGLPLFLLGHSMGALISLDYLLHSSKDFQGAVISGAPLEPRDSAPPYLVAISKFLSAIAPSTSLKMKIDGSALSRNPDVARAYDEDPLVFYDRSVRWASEFLKTIQWVKANGSKLDLPVFFFHGEKDPIVAADGTQHLYDQVAYPDKTLRIYPGAMHESMNDLDFQQVTADIQAWLDTHLS